MTRFGSPMAITVADAGSQAEMQQVRAKMLLWTLGDPEVALRGFSQLVQHVEDFRPQLELVTETNGLPSTGCDYATNIATCPFLYRDIVSR